jgi:hypothetical protein
MLILQVLSCLYVICKYNVFKDNECAMDVQKPEVASCKIFHQVSILEYTFE